jgi:hypothetical protein
MNKIYYNIYSTVFCNKQMKFSNSISLLDCVPLVLIITYLLYPTSFVYFSQYSLGKLVAVLLIIYYTHKHFVYGFSLCIFVIWYYQIWEYSKVTELFTHNKLTDSIQQYVNHLPKPANEPNAISTDFIQEPSRTKSSSCLINIAYPNNLPVVCKESENIFRKEHCTINKVMVYKDLEVKHHDITHHLSEIDFHNGEICNPCDSTCHFDLRKKKENSENDLRKPDKPRNYAHFIPEEIRQLGLFTDSGKPFVGNSSYIS